MKPASIILSLACALHGGTAVNLNAQSWETLVDIETSNGNALIVDQSSPDASLPHLYIGGNGPYGSVHYLDQSTDPVTITPLDQLAGNTIRLAQDVSGNLYSASATWQVRKLSGDPLTWSVLDDNGSWNPTGTSAIRGLAIDSQGNVFVSGSAFDRRGKEYWVIRKGSNFGQNWVTSYKSSKPLASGMGMVFVSPIDGGHPGGLFAVGTLTETKTTQWSVLRSRDSGVTWQWVDAWGTSKLNGGAHARAITADSTGNIYVAGYDAMGTPAWYVRRSQDGGDTWETILTEYTDGDYNRADDIAADPWGNVYVVGLTQWTGSGAQWTIRRWDAAAQTWDQWPDTLRHPLSPLANVSLARGVTSDASGRVYVTGSADGNWVVQCLVFP